SHSPVTWSSSMKWTCSLIALVTSLVATGALAQSQPSDPVDEGSVTGRVARVIEESGVAVAVDSIARTTTSALNETFEQLATTLGELADRVASDPELRRSAFAAVQGMAELSSSLIAENADVIEEALRKAADELERMGDANAPRRGETSVPGTAPGPAGAE